MDIHGFAIGYTRIYIWIDTDLYLNIFIFFAKGIYTWIYTDLHFDIHVFTLGFTLGYTRIYTWIYKDFLVLSKLPTAIALEGRDAGSRTRIQKPGQVATLERHKLLI